jgi:glucose/arabinose dehydrogenase
VYRFWLLASLIVVLAALFAPPAWAESPPAGTIVELYAAGRGHPVAMAFASDGRLFYTEKGGYTTPTGPRVITLQGPPSALREKVWIQLSNVDSRDERGLLGIALDPDFVTNGYVYLFYTNASNPKANRVVRYTERRSGADVGTGDPNSALVLMEFPLPVSDDYMRRHNGGNIHFGPDGYLYVTHGELSRYDYWAQDLTLPFGKIHRIDVREPYNAPPNQARAPLDNPFYNDGNPATGNDDRIWSYGHRNSFDFTFDRYVAPGQQAASNFMFASENGPECNDELLRVVRGYNQRWPLDKNCPNPPQDATGLLPSDPPVRDLAYFTPVIAPTGITVYNGSIPEWKGGLFFCAVNTDALYHATLTADRTALEAAPQTVELPSGMRCEIDVETGANGALYFSSTTDIYRIRPINLCPADLNGDRAVDSSDLQLLADNFRSSHYDLTGDGIVTLADVMLAAVAFGQPCE